MTTDTEKQLFEIFDIPKIFKTTINVGDLDRNYKEIQAPTLKELYEQAQYDFDTPIYFSWFKRSKRWSEEYPQITDSILLEIEDIIHNEYNILIYEKLMHSIRITAHFMDDNSGCDSSYYRVQAEAETKKEALLVLATDINVKDTIKRQVQELFKEE